MKKNPEQTEQTRKNLKDAYWKLFSSDKNITVDNITVCAGYNRCTFYRYYNDTEQVLEEIEIEICEQIQCIAVKGLGKNDPQCFMDDIVGLYEQQGNIICTLLEKDPRFVNMMKNKMEPIILAYYDQADFPHAKLIVAFIAGAIPATLLEWYKSGKTMSIDAVSSFLTDTIAHGIFKKKPHKVEKI